MKDRKFNTPKIKMKLPKFLPETPAPLPKVSRLVPERMSPKSVVKAAPFTP